MATGNTIQMELQLKSNIAETNKQAAQLNKTLTETQKLASGVSRPKAISSAPKSVSNAIDSGLNRGATGVGGGSEGKDFARQAQGLGGLVHVYATFAANIFAVTAAFTALKKAADYTNMIEGLNQLGAMSGKNLGSISKSIVELTDHAVSLREAMEVTAQSTAAGLSSSQISRLAEVAKKASQALGRDVGDSLSRLSRGIAKIEPELLDEIGIMVRVDRAARDYAATLGKTALSLTEFERRQSFAIAVLKQGEEKFGKIKIDANPYSKLEASFFNLLIKGGELLNTVLGPIAKLLAESPVALGTTIAAFASMLLSKAIPAMAQWRGGLVESAKAATDTAKRLAEAHESFKINRDLASANTLAEPMVKASMNNIASIQTALGLSLGKNSKILAEAMSDSFKPTQAFVDKIGTELKKSETSLGKLKAERLKEEYKNNKAITDEIDKQIAAGEKKVANMTLAVNRGKEELHNAEKTQAVYDTMEKDPKYLSEEAAHKRNAISAEKTSNRLTVLSSVSENVKTMGILGAIEKLDKDIEEKGEKINKNLTKIQGRAIAGISAITTFASSLGNVFAYVAIGAAALAILDTVFSKNTKQVEEFHKSTDAAVDSLLNLRRTVEYARNAGELFNTQNVLAFATAVDSVSSGIADLIVKFKEAKQEASGWDNFKNWFADLFNADMELTLAKRMANAFKTLEASLTNSKDLKKLQTLVTDFGIKDSSLIGIQKHYDALLNEGKIAEAERFSKALKGITTEIANSASALESLKNASDASEKSMQTLMNSFLPSDAFSKFGVDQINQAHALAKAVKDPINAIVALTDLVQDFNKLAIMPEGRIRDQLLLDKEKIIDLNGYLKAYDESIKYQKQVMLDLEKAGETDKVWAGGKLTDVGHSKAYKEAQFNIEYSETEKAKLATDLENYRQKGIKLASDLYDAGAEKLTNAIRRSMEESAISFKKVIAGGIGGYQGAIVNAKLDNELIDVQIRSISMQEALIISNTELRLAYEKEGLERKQASETLKGTAGDDPLMVTLRDSLKANETAANIIKVYGDKGGKAFLDAVHSERNYEAKLSLGTAASQVQGSIGAKSKLAADKDQNLAKRDLTIIQEKWKLATEINNLETESNNKALEALKIRTSSVGTYNAELEAEKERLAIRNDSLAISNEEYKLGEIQTAAAYRLANTKDKNLIDSIKNQARDAEVMQQKRIDNAKIVEEQNRVNRVVETTNKLYEAQIANLDLVSNSYSSISDLVSGYNNIARDALESNNIATQRTIDLQKQRFQYSSDLLNIEKEIAKARVSGADISLLERQREMLQFINTEKLKSIQLQSEYLEALAKTEDTMRSIEKGSLSGSFSTYLTALTDNFNDKLTAMIKAAKSAGDAFNQGLISSIDNQIDKFTELLKDRKMSSADRAKALQQFAVDSIKTTVATSVSTYMKNSWKEMLKPFLGKSDAEVAAEKAAAAAEELQRKYEVSINAQIEAQKDNTIAVKDNTASKSSPSPSSSSSPSYSSTFGTNSSVDSGYMLLTGIKDITENNSNVWKQMSDFTDKSETLVNKDEKNTNFFGRFVGGFGSAITTFGSIISRLGGGNGTSGGILGGVASVVNTVGGTISSVSGIINAATSLYTAFSGGGIVAQFGAGLAASATPALSAAIAPAVLEAATGAFAAGASIGTAVGTTAASALSTVATVVPWAAAAFAVASAFGMFGKSKPAPVEWMNADVPQSYTDAGNRYGTPERGPFGNNISFGQHLSRNGVSAEQLMSTVTRPMIELDKVIAQYLKADEVSKVTTALQTRPNGEHGWNQTEINAVFMERLGVITDALGGWVDNLADTATGTIQEKYTQIAQILSIRTNAFAEQFANELFTDAGKAFIKEGETTIQAFVRLSGVLEVINPLMKAMDQSLYDVSLSGAAAAYSLVEVAGGLGPLVQGLSAYYEAIYTEEEKLAAKRVQLNEAFATIGITNVPATISQYRALVDVQDRNTVAGREMYWELIKLGPAFAEVTSAVSDLLQGIIDAADKAGNDARDSALQAAEAAFASLQRAVEHERVIRETTLKTAEDLVSKLTSIIGTLKGGIDSLYDSVDSTMQSLKKQGEEFVHSALLTAKATGVLPDNVALSDAIKNASVDTVYASQFEADFAKLKLAGELSQLKVIADSQLVEAETSLELAKAQLLALDDILNNAQKQLDEAKGLDTSLTSIADALDNLAAALLRLQSFTGGAGSTAASSDNRTFVQGLYSTMFKREGETAGVDYWTNKLTADQASGMSPEASKAEIVRGFQGSAEGIIRGYYSTYLNRTPSLGEVQAWTGYMYNGASVESIRQGFLNSPEYLSSHPTPLATGTNYIPYDGFSATLHRGEAVVPAMYNPAANAPSNNTSQDTSKLETLVTFLTTEVQRLQSIVREGNTYSRRTAEAVNGNSEQPMLVVTA